jgi:hypothetical protein
MNSVDGRGMSRRSAIGFTGLALAASAVPTDRAFAAQSNRQTQESPSFGINVKSFGAQGDANADGSTGTDDTAAIQSALDQLASVGGGTLFFPEGYYKVSSYLTVPPFATLIGAGHRSSGIIGVHAGGGGANAAENVRNGSILYSAFPINTTSTAHIQIERLGAGNSNPDNQGAGFYQQSGESIVIRDCSVGGKYGIILDQSEDVLIESCEIGSSVPGGAGIWIVNGADLTPGALSQFTNSISLIENHYNMPPGCYGILDDGGVSHRIIGGGFNGGINGLRAAGVVGLTIVEPYFEGQSDACIIIAASTFAGDGTVGGSTANLVGGFFSAGKGTAIQGAGSAGSLIVHGGYYAGSAIPLKGASKFARLSINNPANMTGQPFTDHDAWGIHVDVSKMAASTATGRVGAINTPGVSGGATFTPHAANGFVETFNPAGRRQGYGFLSKDGALLFAAEGANTSFQFLSPISCKGSITSAGGGVGYETGAGGTANQATSKSTGVTLNKPSGHITMNAEALAGWTTSSFLLTNNMVAAGDLLILNHVSGGTLGAYSLNAHGSAAGSVIVDVTNISPNSLSEPIVIGFAVIKAVTA